MSRGVVTLQRTASASASVGHLSCPGASMRRIRLYEFVFGSEGTPADVANLWQWQRTTAIGTSTGVTPQLLDPADAALITVAGQNHTVEPTYTANAIMHSAALNQKATYRWIAAPECEIIVPATANNGLGLKTPTAGSSVGITATAYFQE